MLSFGSCFHFRFGLKSFYYAAFPTYQDKPVQIRETHFIKMQRNPEKNAYLDGMWQRNSDLQKRRKPKNTQRTEDDKYRF
jgi:hypothetical protein